MNITVLGSETLCGAYILRINVRRDRMVRFGRFQNGRMIHVPQGDVVYIGSAMAQRGSMTLARRLIRHATRSDWRRPQPIREEMLKVFAEAGLGTVNLEPPARKKLSWNIDHLLEEDGVELSQVIVMRTMMRLEDSLAQFMEEEPGTSIIEKGLGAHDRPGHTHLFHVRETAEWWYQLSIRLAKNFTKIL